MKRIFKNKQRLITWALFGALLVVGIAALYVFYNFNDTNSLRKYAEQVMEECADSNYRPACYDVEIPKLMDQGLTMEEAFEVTSIIQDGDSSYWYCHVLGHNISAKEAAKDISRWTEVVARSPSGMCSNGSLHGAFQERFRGEFVSEAELEELIPEVKSICQQGEGRDFTGLEQASCYHALGHLTMYITNADVSTSLGVCDRVAVVGKQDFKELCYDGAFMQVFQPLEPEDIALVQDFAPETPEDSKVFCDRFSGGYRQSCLTESWPLFIDEIKESPKKVTDFCGRSETSENKRRCYNAIFYVLAAQTNFNADSIGDFCSQLSGEVQAQCFANSASRFLETDYRLAPKAAEVCAIAEQQGVGDACYEEVLFYSIYNYHAESEPFIQLCEALPAPWDAKCLNRDGERIILPVYTHD
jgi:hypothetical protein